MFICVYVRIYVTALRQWVNFDKPIVTEKIYHVMAINMNNNNYVKYISNNSYLNCGCRWKWRVIITVNFQFSNWKEEAWKNQGHNGIRTRSNPWPPRIPVRCIISLLMGKYELNKLTSLPMCGFIAQLVEHRTGIAEVTGSNPVEALIFFQASSFQLLKLENLLRWSLFAFIYNRSTNMNYFI